MYIEENYTEYFIIHNGMASLSQINYTEYDHNIGAYSKLSTKSPCRLDYIY